MHSTPSCKLLALIPDASVNELETLHPDVTPLHSPEYVLTPPIVRRSPALIFGRVNRLRYEIEIDRRTA